VARLTDPDVVVLAAVERLRRCTIDELCEELPAMTAVELGEALAALERAQLLRWARADLWERFRRAGNEWERRWEPVPRSRSHA
jgi:hypothetical protein